MRLTPLPAEEWNDDVVRALSVLMPPERAQPDRAGNMLGTFARHPRLTKAYLTFNVHLLMNSTLSQRITETIVLRTAVRRGSRYLWEHHVPLGKRAGLTDNELEAVRVGSGIADPLEASVVAAVDELHDRTAITDATWGELAARLNDQQLMDLVFTAGCYSLLAMAIESFGIEDEGGDG
ncbi:hypothetical protein Mycch_3628 [Mycolicibacterium chubuense NBB4]|uniref:Carboxymuconolactone decarboxylase-like domain-containing protein n=1 Tax=Mycolicibacterium chubuense (strain NBB4) TaxID=710421 RepID=I4BM54_MYCCN|nr:carboxymuconolactone decarboxylase family protein [Mycolicibacterium chubuense]AFM18361.1 hypothetical protein Mycch_3628 [Mycolicibacterium chubuense NBB4]